MSLPALTGCLSAQAAGGGVPYTNTKCVEFVPGVSNRNYQQLTFGSTKGWPGGSTVDATYALFKEDNAFSVSLWLKSTTSTSVVAIPWGRYNGGTTNAPGVNASFSPTGVNYFFFRNAAGGIMQNNTGTTALWNGDWHHVVWTYDGSGNASGLKFYMDDALVAWTTTGSNLGTASSIQVSSAFILGNRETETSRANSYNYEGKMDEVSLWDVELSLAEVQEIYNSGDPADLNSHSQATKLVHWFRLGDASGDTITATQPNWSTNNIDDASTAGAYTRAIGTTNRYTSAQCNIVTDAPP